MRIIPERKRLIIWLIIVIAFAVAKLSFDYGLIRVFILPIESPSTITFKSWIDPDTRTIVPGSGVYSNKITSSKDIMNIVDVFRFSRSHLNHRCAALQRLSFHYSDGREITVGLLSSHETNSMRCEFRYKGILYYINKEDYYSAMTNAGIPSKYIIR